MQRLVPAYAAIARKLTWRVDLRAAREAESAGCVWFLEVANA